MMSDFRDRLRRSRYVIFFFWLAVARVSAGPTSWTATTSLPDGYNSHALAYSSPFLYQTGGTANQNGFYAGVNCFYSRVNNGTAGVWTATSPLPEAVSFHCEVATSSYLYVLGGYHYTDANGLIITNVVYVAKIKPDGSLDTWKSARSLPSPRVYASAAVWNNIIFVIGGYDEPNGYATDYATVYSARVLADGSLSAWTALTPLPAATVYHASAANGYLYLVSGAFNIASQVTSNVYYAKINANGTLSAWHSTTPLPQPESMHGVVASGGHVFSIGGFNGSGPTRSYFYAPVQADGTLGTWITGPLLPQIQFQNGVAVTETSIFSTGGSDNSGFAYDTDYSIRLPQVVATPPIVVSQSVSNQVFSVVFGAETGITNGIDYSTNLISWLTVTNPLFSIKDGMATWSDDGSQTGGAGGRKFYRINAH